MAKTEADPIPREVYRIKAEPEGGGTVTVPALPGCVTWGENYEHALAMAHEAIEGFLEVLVEEGKPIPTEPVTTPSDMLIQVASRRMSRLPSLNPRQVVEALKKDGFEERQFSRDKVFARLTSLFATSLLLRPVAIFPRASECV